MTATTTAPRIELIQRPSDEPIDIEHVERYRRVMAREGTCVLVEPGMRVFYQDNGGFTYGVVEAVSDERCLIQVAKEDPEEEAIISVPWQGVFVLAGGPRPNAGVDHGCATAPANPFYDIETEILMWEERALDLMNAFTVDEVELHQLCGAINTVTKIMGSQSQRFRTGANQPVEPDESDDDDSVDEE